MAILAIDTSMAACSAAILLPGSASPIQRFEPMTRGHAEALFPMVEAVLAEADCGFRDLSSIAVTVGPGSFTGVRAGLAAARGFALAADKPVIAATSLEVMAKGCVARCGALELAEGFAIIQDARRDELYVQQFSADGTALGAPEVLSVADALAALGPSINIVAGSGAQSLADAALVEGRKLTAILPGLLPEAANLTLIAAERAPLNHPPSPLYLRAPDAKPQAGKSLERAGS